MNTSLLASLMQIAIQQTGADRAMVCDTHLAIVDSVNLEQADMLSEHLTDIIQKAIASGQPLITNNAVRDAANAPLTKTNFDNLRGVVVIPVAGVGALYLDRPLKQGIIAKNTVNRLMKVAEQAAKDNSSETTAAKLGELYQQTT
ncbi:MAG: hypothetical protein GC179_16600 [Anaerolineaceae bacterium]|nr:hypothetical protein [Anaerolineaceae bacterium]